MQPPTARHVLIIEDHPAVQDALATLVRDAFAGVNVHCADRLDKAERKAERIDGLDLVILDLGLPDSQGVDSLIRARRTFSNAPVMVFSAQDDPESVVACLKEGAAGFIPKTSARNLIVIALWLARSGGVYFPADAIASRLSRAQSPTCGVASKLTTRQLDVLRLMLKGYKNARIARELNISEGTVKQHSSAIFEAVGVATRGELLAAAARGAIRQDGSPITKVV